jgi:PleD family two-component response regulator
VSEPQSRVLLADDDPDLRMFLEVTLDIAGFEVHAVGDGAAAVDAARELHPDVILLDVMMPNTDGLAATEQLRDDPRTSDIPIILVTAKAMGSDKVLGLEQGADDYVTKPFDPDELVARIHAALRRSSAMRQVSPLSGLPGNTRIEAELERRIATGGSFALLYCDLNKFKAYNDHYGFMEGDRVLRAYADLLNDVVAVVTPEDAFVGHVGGDDFVIVTGSEDYEVLAAELCDAFDALAPSFYTPEDRDRGYIEVENRRGEIERIGFVSVDIGIAHSDNGVFEHPGAAVAVATEMKHVAKSRDGGSSTFATDRRGMQPEA